MPFSSEISVAGEICLFVSLYVATEEMGPNPRNQIKEKSFKIILKRKCGIITKSLVFSYPPPPSLKQLKLTSIESMGVLRLLSNPPPHFFFGFTNRKRPYEQNDTNIAKL